MFIINKYVARFGNNVFQYFACKLIQYYVNKNHNANFEYKIYTNESIENCIFIDEEKFVEFYYLVKHGYLPDKNVILFGFFQKCEIFIPNKDLILKWFNDDNGEYINGETTIKDITTYINNFKPIFEETDLILHLRYDDYRYYGFKCIHNDSIVNLMKNEKFNIFTKVKIICNIRADWEVDNIKYIISKFPDKQFEVFHQDDLLNDFSKLYYSKNIICSNSTFCWLAVFLGNCNNFNYVPDKWFAPNQSLLKIDEKSIVFNTKYECE